MVAGGEGRGRGGGRCRFVVSLAPSLWWASAPDRGLPPQPAMLCLSCPPRVGGAEAWPRGGGGSFCFLPPARSGRLRFGSAHTPTHNHSRSYFFSNSPVRWRLTKVVLPVERVGERRRQIERLETRAAASRGWRPPLPPCPSTGTPPPHACGGACPPVRVVRTAGGAGPRESLRACNSRARAVLALPPPPTHTRRAPVPPSPTRTSLKEGTPSGVTWPGSACGNGRAGGVVCERSCAIEQSRGAHQRRRGLGREKRGEARTMGRGSARRTRRGGGARR